MAPISTASGNSESEAIAATSSTDATEMTPESRNEAASKLVDKFAIWSGVAGLIPVPIVDIIAVGGLQLEMLESPHAGRRDDDSNNDDNKPVSERKLEQFVEQVAESLPDAAYRFCRAEPGIHVVLSGTGKIAHLEQNVASILRPPLPDSIRTRLIDLFAGVDTVSGQ